jgi:hypothetical protein
MYQLDSEEKFFLILKIENRKETIFFSIEYTMSDTVLVFKEAPLAYNELEKVYESYNTTYYKTMLKPTVAREGKNVTDMANTYYKLYEIIFTIIKIINENKHDFEPFKKVALFKKINTLLNNFKQGMTINDDILAIRKCVNWIRKVDREDDFYF